MQLTVGKRRNDRRLAIVAREDKIGEKNPIIIDL